MTGLFISFEGGEGTGKSTQIERLRSRLEGLGHTVIMTREPGGPDSAEAIRELLITGNADRWADVTELLLMNAARAENLQKLILPARHQGAIVLTDRFADSTRAYQGAAGGINPKEISALEDIVVGQNWPDLTFIFDLPAREGSARAHERGVTNRFEQKDPLYHEKVRQHFLEIARAEPARCHVIDARGSIDAIAEQIFEIVREKLSAQGMSAKRASE